MRDPRSYNINHDSWRPGQFEAIQAVLASPNRHVVLSAPTGSGKTALGMALSNSNQPQSVRSLTVTRALQGQYGDYPDVEVLYGMSAYPCAHARFEYIKADACMFPDNMMSCPDSERCQYLIQRARTKDAYRQALSYKYYFLAAWPKAEPTNILYCDEAHYLPQIIMDHMTLSVNVLALVRLRLPTPPNLPPLQSVRKNIIRGWMFDVVDKASERLEYLDEEMIHETERARIKRDLDGLVRKYQPVAEALDNVPDDFFVDVEDDGQIVVYAMSAAPFFKTLFGQEDKFVFASATIGNPNEFAKLVGINRDDMQFVQVKHAFPPNRQPVYTYSDAPKMSHSVGDAAYAKQAEIVKRIADQFPRKSLGLVHASSIQGAEKLAQQIEKQPGMRGRTWVPPTGTSTEQKIAIWRKKCEKRPDLICVAYSFHTGLDAPEVVFNIVAKVPFMPMNTFGMELIKRNKTLYGWLAAVTIEQACGRNRRGEEEHYEVEGQPQRKHVAIIDNNYVIIRKYFSEFFRECLVKV
jgi:Rad3-related DNA helicase